MTTKTKSVSGTKAIPLTDREDIVFAGNSRFTIVSQKTGERYTFWVKKHKKDDVWFVSVLTGSNNDDRSNYRYLGYINQDFEYRTTRKSFKSENLQNVFRWFYACMEKTTKIEMFHEGRCCRCGRVLTVPESIESGWGPECIKYKQGIK